MNILSHFSLKNYNTFGINVTAKQFVEVQTLEELQQILKEHKDQQKFILGGGSNMLLTKDIDALVIYIHTKGKKVIKEEEEYIWIEAQAGENWHDFVLWTIENNYGGLENMSLIPGNVGTSPIQNIGAYGIEIKDVLYSCNTINIATQEEKSFTNSECHFGYRESIFKQALKDKVIITSVVFKLTKKNHSIHISYGDIQTELGLKNIVHPSLKAVSDAVIAIRQSKLPDPKVLGNSGSFFKNPILLKTDFLKIQKNFPDMKYYDVSPTEVKVPAGWLIEKAGFKGKRYGDAGVHEKQALVLVNYGNASGNDILNVAKNIQTTILNTFGITIEMEVNIF